MTKTIRTKAGEKHVDQAFLSHAGLDAHIRLLSLDDAEDLLALEHACFNPAYYDSLLTRATVSHFCGPANGVILVYKDQGRIAGYAQITFKSNLDAGRFYSLAVHPDFQGKGAGGALFDGAEKFCKAVGAPTVLLEIREDNAVLKARYEKRGYKVYRKVPDYYADKAAALKMKQTLR